MIRSPGKCGACYQEDDLLVGILHVCSGVTRFAECFWKFWFTYRDIRAIHKRWAVCWKGGTVSRDILHVDTHASRNASAAGGHTSKI